jgi:hypothetical protein
MLSMAIHGWRCCLKPKTFRLRHFFALHAQGPTTGRANVRIPSGAGMPRATSSSTCATAPRLQHPAMTADPRGCAADHPIDKTHPHCIGFVWTDAGACGEGAPTPVTRWINEIHIGDCRQLLRRMLADRVHIQTCVTSPPYHGLRDYGTERWDGGDPSCQHRVGDRVPDTLRAFRTGAVSTHRSLAANAVPCPCRFQRDRSPASTHSRRRVGRIADLLSTIPGSHRS